ncbi:polyamine aminopropyltransferase [Streptomyces sp. NPDC048389]|uniref:polyamine aminopropyltransferase n=1 Tax=Streptomyces sp. NPDC048389 TaxID=3154622 RepID=UPI0034527E86
MIDRPQTSPSPQGTVLPVRPDTGRRLVLAAVFVCAACGLVYELELVALATYLIGDSVTQASVVLSLMVFAMGVGSLLAKRLRCRAAVAFGLLEAALALIGGLSAMVLYASFAWFGDSSAVLVCFSLTIGVLIGAEIPLLMSLIQRISRRDAEGTVADLFAADYVGALVGGLAFPFLLLPWLGELTGALVTGALNTVAGGAVVLWLFRGELTPRWRARLLLVNALVLALLAGAMVMADDFEAATRRAVYGPEVRVAVRTGVQEVVLTGAPSRPPDLFLNGRLKVRGHDEHRFIEALVHPAMNGPHERVLILGGGDGLAAREVLRHADVGALTIVEFDPGVIRLARSDPGLTALNDHVYDDPRVRVVTADAFTWLREHDETPYDVIVSDLPDPGISAGTKLYSLEFYGLARRALADGGRFVVHAGPTARPRTYWTVDATLRAAGYGTVAYRVRCAEAGAAGGPERFRAAAARSTDWGLLLAAVGRTPRLGLGPDTPPLRSDTQDTLARDAAAAERTRLPGLAPSTLVHPRYTP